jgi:methionine-rich copper-binding protein CopC
VTGLLPNRTVAATVASIALSVASVLVSAPPALAHARLVRAKPADKAVLTQAPAQLDLWFSELLDANFNQVEVFPVAELTAKTRSNLTGGPPVIDPGDRTHLTVPLRALPPGEYVVEWRVLSRDGHSAPGRFRFRVVGSP